MQQNDIKSIVKFINSVAGEYTQEQLHFTGEECNAFFDSIKSNPLSKKHFYLAIHLSTYSLSFQLYLSDYFGLKCSSTLNDFFDAIHPDYKDTFFQWAKSAHLVAVAHPEFLNILDISYKIMLPLRNANGCYYWVLQESYVLQMNQEKQMISQFNTYTVVGEYDKPQEMFGWVAGKLNIDVEKDAVLKRFYNQISNFSLTIREQEIINLLKKTTDLGYKSLGEQLNIEESTVQKHANNIIQIAKTAFPHYFYKKEKTTIKNVINYLNQLDFITNDDIPQASKG